MSIDAKLTLDVGELIRSLERLDFAVQDRISRRAVSRGGDLLLAAIEREAPVYRGVLKESLGQKVKLYKQSNTTVSIIGPRIGGGFRGYHGHLVHDGHIAVDGSFVPGNPFQRRAVEASRDAALEAVKQSVAADIEKEASKHK